MSQRRILLVEDDLDIATLVELHLRDCGFDVVWVATGPEGRARAMAESWDLVVLDLMLPGLDGLDVCRQLRAAASHLPILMLTARSSEVDRVLGLELGADDYLTKPFSIRELTARVKALLRRVDTLRGSQDSLHATIAAGPLQISVARREVTRGGVPIGLTAREFDLLVHFARHPGRVYTRAELLDQVWGLGHDGYEHTVNSHINRLRAKIEDTPASPSYILTVWGVGYKFSDARQESA
ncbi:MAG: response regulator transcription factor [Acidobacteria bacterium]|nr:response regulator transcription factor [Acidobacteriota bacterium]